MNRWQWIVFAGLVLIVSVPSLLSPTSAQDFGANWRGEYFDGSDFDDDDLEFTRTDAAINFNWGSGSPDNDISDDDFTVRWTADINFANGTYQFTGGADDGLRAVVDGITIMDFLGNDGDYEQRSATLNLTEGSHRIEVRYRERDGDASVQFFWEAISLQPTSTPGPTLTPSNTSPPQVGAGQLGATVIRAQVLNVRAEPNTGAAIIDRILRGQTYPVVGRDPGARWFLLDLGGGRRGWVYGYYLYVDGNEFMAPVVSIAILQSVPADVPDTGVVAVTRAGLKLRSEPDMASVQIGRVTWGSLVPVVGRSQNGGWYQIVWKGTVGWVASGYLQIRQGELESVPIR